MVTFSPMNLYLNNLSYSVSNDVNIIEPVSWLPDSDALKSVLSLKVKLVLTLLPLKILSFW